ncbi:MAG: glutaredoxin family protein [Nanoarchaeota archaeon]|nr:glutaredoxin family protein [Nanoarchaeota archaeon]
MKVAVYGTKTCVWCRKTREFLKEHKIKFKDIDIEKSKKAEKTMIRISGQEGFPVIDVNGKIVLGYDEDKLRRLLAKK